MIRLDGSGEDIQSDITYERGLFDRMLSGLKDLHSSGCLDGEWSRVGQIDLPLAARSIHRGKG